MSEAPINLQQVYADMKCADRIREALLNCHEAILYAKGTGLEVTLAIGGMGYSFDPKDPRTCKVTRTILV
jgi:hypothetical protein